MKRPGCCICHNENGIFIFHGLMVFYSDLNGGWKIFQKVSFDKRVYLCDNGSSDVGGFLDSKAFFNGEMKPFLWVRIYVLSWLLWLLSGKVSDGGWYNRSFFRLREIWMN